MTDLELFGALIDRLAEALAKRLSPGAEEPDRLLNVKEASALLGGISADSLYRSPIFKPTRVALGGRMMFSRKAIQALIERRRGR